MCRNVGGGVGHQPRCSDNQASLRVLHGSLNGSTSLLRVQQAAEQSRNQKTRSPQQIYYSLHWNAPLRGRPHLRPVCLYVKLYSGCELVSTGKMLKSRAAAP